MAQRRVAAAAAPARIAMSGIMAAQTDLKIFIRAQRRALGIKTLPELFNVHMDKRQNTEQGEGNIGDKPDTRLQEGVILHFNGGDADADQVNIQHYPLLEPLQHQQYRSQIHAQHVAQPQVGD